MLVPWQDGLGRGGKKNEIENRLSGRKHARLEMTVSASAAAGPQPAHSPALTQGWLE
jgi:hypothetical protein